MVPQARKRALLTWMAATALAASLLAAACMSLERAAPPVTPAMVHAAPAPATLTDLEAGRQVYLSKCLGCHAVEPVAKHSLQAWPRIVASMSKRSKLTSQQEQQLLAYLLAARSWIDLHAGPPAAPP